MFTNDDINLVKYLNRIPSPTRISEFFTLEMCRALIARLEAAERRGNIAAQHVIGICLDFELADIEWRRTAGQS